MMRNIFTILAVLGVLAGALALTFVSPVPLPRSIEVIPPVENKLVCAPMSDPGVLFFDRADAFVPLNQEDGDAAAGPTLVEDHQESSVIRGGAGVSGGDVVTATGASTFLPCSAPRSRGTIIVPGTAGTDVFVVNPDASEAVVDLTLYGTEGEIVALGARGIAVGPYSSRTIALSVVAAVEGPVGVEYRASRGRTAVIARTDAPGVLEAATSSTDGRDHLLAGIPQGASSVLLLVTNPGNKRATLDVTALGASLAYAPEAAAGVTVPAHTTIEVDLTPSLAGEVSGLRVTSDVDVTAALSTVTGSDIAHASPAEAGTELGAFAPAAGVLQLSNPGDAEATVSVTIDVIDQEPVTSQGEIPAGVTIAVPMSDTAPRGQSVSVTSDAELIGAIVDTVDGASVIPLTPLVGPAVEPVDAEIVPTLQ